MNTSVSRRSRRTSSAVPVVFLMLAQGCSATHEIEKADTATSWLRACMGDGECTGASRCIAHLCSISCDEGRDSCAAMAREARCEQPPTAREAICDLPCDNSDDCAPLRGDYACQEGYCRPSSVLEASSRRLTLMASTDLEAWPAMGAISTWTGDRFRVAVAGRTPEKVQPISVLGVSELFPDGALISKGRPAVEPRLPEDPFYMTGYPLAISRDGTIVSLVRTQSGPPPDAGVRETLHFLLPDGREPPTVECARDASVAPAAQGSHWLVLCRDNEGVVNLGRYDPLAADWASAPRPVTRELDPGDVVTLAVRGDDAFLLWNEPQPGAVARIVGAAGPLAQPIGPEPTWQMLDPGVLPTNDTRANFPREGTSGDWLVPFWKQYIPGPNNSVTISYLPMSTAAGFRLQANGSTSGPVRFPLSVREETRLHAIQALPDTGHVAFCYEEYDSDDGERERELLLSLFDERGNRVAGPHRLNGLGSAGSECRLAWSGSQLLADWLEHDGNIDRSSSVNARLFNFNVR